MSRHSYEARVLLAPCGPSARADAAEFARLGLEGVTELPVPDGGPSPVMPDLERVADADVVVLLAADLAEVQVAVVERIGTAARLAGCLVAGLLVSPADDRAGAPTGPAVIAFREATDMLVMVRSAALAAAFLDVVRGGNAVRPHQDRVR